MKHKLLAAAGVAALMVVPSVASAQDIDEGWYARGNIGIGVVTDSAISNGIVGDVQGEGNGAGSLGLGYDFGNNWRVELDGSTLWNDLGLIDNVGNTNADVRSNALMLNAIYDFNEFGKWEPYIGAGIGLVNSKLSANAHAIATIDSTSGTPVPVGIFNPTCYGTCSVTDKDTNFGWQFLAGLGYDITDRLSWDTNYRYLDAGEGSYEGIAFANQNNLYPDTFRNTIDVDYDLAAHMLMTGFRYKFGAAPTPAYVPPAPDADYKCWDGAMVFNASECRPTPPPTPVANVSCWDGSMVFNASECPAQPQTYSCWDNSLVYDRAQCPATPAPTIEQQLCGQEYISQIVYFEFNKPQSPETLSQMQNILNISDVCQVGSVNLVGHTDTVGSAAYNLGLSRRRAEGVKGELVKLGVPGQLITTDGKGETELFVPTADNVKEQLNRRVEVGIRLNSVTPSY